MLPFTRKLVIFFVLLTSHLTWALPQDDEDGNENPVNEEHVEEGEEEYYEEEAIKVTTKSTPGVHSTGDEEVDNYLKRNFNVKKIVSEKLGITNFSRQSLYEHGAQTLFSYIAERPDDKITTELPTSTSSVNEPSLVNLRTRKYKVQQKLTTSENPVKFSNSDDDEEEVKKTFEITVPNDVSSNAGDTIEISIPKHLTSDAQLNIVESNNLEHQSKSKEEDGEGVKSIEEAIQQALLLAQQMTGFNISSVIIEDKNVTKTIELGVTDPTKISATATSSFKGERDLNSTLKAEESSEVINLKTSGSDSTEKSKLEVRIKGTRPKIVENVQTTPEGEYEDSIEEIIERTRKPVIVRTTTARPTLTSNPFADMLKSRFQNNGISGFFFDRAVNATKSGAKFAAGAVWCALFDYCPDDKEADERAL